MTGYLAENWLRSIGEVYELDRIIGDIVSKADVTLIRIITNDIL